MNILTQKILIPNQNVELYIRREDLIHPYISGNKFRKLKYNIEEAQKEGIIIIDNSSCLYNDDSIYNFSYEDTITLDIITLEKVAGPELVAIVYTTHEYGKNLNEVNLPIGDDGLFNVNHIIIPTVDWYYK